MFELPFCSGDYGSDVSRAPSFACTKITTSSSTPAQNMVKCIYLTNIKGTRYHITLIWSKSISPGLGLSLYACEYNMKRPNTTRPTMKPWFVGKKKGKIILPFGPDCEVTAFWDFSSARYHGSSPEPLEGFFFALVHCDEIILLLGNMPLEAYRKTHATSFPSEITNMISRREHVFGRNMFSTKARFGETGRCHDIAIECNVRAREPKLSISVDKQIVVNVKRLMWKFRGNQTFLVDGLRVELFWDVHNWFFSPSDGHAIFMFNTTTVTDKSWSSLGVVDNPLMQWHHTSSSMSSIQDVDNIGFSLLLYAWKSE